MMMAAKAKERESTTKKFKHVLSSVWYSFYLSAGILFLLELPCETSVHIQGK